MPQILVSSELRMDKIQIQVSKHNKCGGFQFQNNGRHGGFENQNKW